MVIKSLIYWFLNYYWHIPQNISLVNVFMVEEFLVFNIQTSQNVHITQYDFWSMFVKKKFTFMFQNLNIFLTKQYACEWYSLLYTKQLFIKSCIVWWSGNDAVSILHPNLIVCYLCIGVLLYFSYILQNRLWFLRWHNTLLFFPFKIIGNRLRGSAFMKKVQFSGMDCGI